MAVPAQYWNQISCFRIDVSSALSTSAENFLYLLPAIGITSPVELKTKNIYFIRGALQSEDLEVIACRLICDAVLDSYEIRQVGAEAQRPPENTVYSSRTQIGVRELEVSLRPGVTDNTATELLRAIRGLGYTGIRSAATGKRYEFSGDISDGDLHLIATSYLVNETVERYALGEIQPEFIQASPSRHLPELFSLDGLDDEELIDLSRERRLALDLDEMSAIRSYFRSEGRPATDAELEMIAQSWSEHCVHKTFKALITLSQSDEKHHANLDEQQKYGVPDQVDSILHTYLQSVTDSIQAPWVRSAFIDNAGVIEFDSMTDLSFKVETHNHPSALEPFGGANTGVGGVVRDVLGVSHRPIANTDTLCFGPADTQRDRLPAGVLHPARIRAGVVAGIEDYGNKLGLPTVNGAVIYHEGYISNPLVYCGSVGIGPRDAHPTKPEPGDRIIVIGGRTGRDGLRGATFSSLALDAETGSVASTAVQIGDPITEKGVIEVVVRARDAKLYHAITDCGAGGLSSAVGEMAESLGAIVDLAGVRLKYPGLKPWEIWLSEAQERMVLAVPAKNLEALAALCEAYRVEWGDIGAFEGSGKLVVRLADVDVINLSNSFLHAGRPRLHLRAEFSRPRLPLEDGNPQQTSARVYSAQEILAGLLAHPNIASKESIIRRFDHEVRGATVVAPLVGRYSDGPSDAAVLKPLETEGWRGFTLANGINPLIGQYDPYAMAVSNVDEAVRNAIAVGADPDRIALLDNFCWGDPRRPEILGGLIRAAQGCHDAALHYGTPFISGKDSLNNEYLGEDGERHAIPGTLLISSISLHPDVRKAVTMDFKQPGSRIYLVGDWKPGLLGSHALLIAGARTFQDDVILSRTADLPPNAPAYYRSIYKAIHTGMILSIHDLSEGGIALAAAEMILAGRLGADLDLSGLALDAHSALFAETNGCFLIEVAPDDEGAFSSLLLGKNEPGDGGPAWLVHKVGEVSAGAHFRLCWEDEIVLDVSVAKLVEAFNPGRWG